MPKKKIDPDKALRFYFHPKTKGRYSWLEIRPGVDDGMVGPVWYESAADMRADLQAVYWAVVAGGDIKGGLESGDEDLFFFDEERETALRCVLQLTGAAEEDGWQEGMPEPVQLTGRLHIVVEASGGVVNEIHCSIPGTTADVIDWDDLTDPDARENEPKLSKLAREKRAAREADRMRAFAPYTSTMVDT